MTKMKSLIYGPVTSRRLGLSLGVDTVPYKICSYDCIYCQIGRTAKTTAARKDYGLAEQIFQDLDRKLEGGTNAEHITLGGSGEPTLNLELGRIIRGVKKRTVIPVAVLTNGSLLWDPDVQDDLSAADVVLPSLDAPDEETFRRINRPHSDISFDRMIDGMVSFARMFKGKIWLEIFLVKNLNTSDQHLEKFSRLVKTIAPDRVHINTAVRPPAESYATAVDKETLASMAAKIGSNAAVIAEFQKKAVSSGQRDFLEDELVETLLRRPCTIKDIAVVLNVDETRVAGLLDRLITQGKVQIRTTGGKTYYMCTEETESPV
jgi:wyosine [tRNA(Phe)-imidazoG37] synthetase (radical SAM superfamily)